MVFRRSLVPFAVLGMVCAIPSQAQRSLPAPRPRPQVTFMAGPSSYDLGGTGTSAFGAVRFDVPVGLVFILEPGVANFRYPAQSSDHITYLFPEVSVQAQVPGGGVRPYLGGGIGFTEFLSGRGRTLVTLHAAAGLRVAVANGWGLRGELRARSVDPFVGSTFDFGFGVSKALRP
jgi:hypothetical protein